jgi:hypothetical protein
MPLLEMLLRGSRGPMLSNQLPASITNDGRPIRGGNDINESDYAFAAKIYPKPGGQGGDDLDWLV